MSLNTPKPPVAVAVVKLHNRFQVKCDGRQITILSNSYDPNAASYIPLLEPLRGAKNQILKRQPEVRDKPTTWWKAQCIFRGLEFSGNEKSVFQSRMRAAPNTEMTVEIRELEAKMVKEYHQEQERENKRASETRWSGLTYEEKAKADSHRMLLESFPLSKPGQNFTTKSDPVILRISQNDKEWDYLLEEMGLQTRCATFPGGHPDKTPIYDSIAIIGRPESDLDRNKEWLEVKRSIQRAQAELENELKQYQQGLLKETKKGKEWDITGKYQIQCPRIESDWRMDFGTLEIFAGVNQLCAKFDFGIITGVMQFERQLEKTKKSTGKKNPATSNPLTKNPSRKRNHDEFEEYGDEEDPSEFQLGPISISSDKNTNWTYRWRGEDTGTAEIERKSDIKSYELKFCKPRGMKIEGTFGTLFLEEACTFTGEKIAVGTGQKIDPSYEWLKRSERGWSRGRRWH